MEVIVNKHSGEWEFDWRSDVEIVMGDIDGQPVECTVKDCVCPEVSMSEITEKIFNPEFKARHWQEFINDLIKRGYESGYKSGYDKGYSDCERSK